MTIPHITPEQAAIMWNAPETMKSVNAAIDEANAKASELTTTVNGESMTVEKAQALFESTKLTHDWYMPNGSIVPGQTWFGVHNTYTYKLKQPKLKLLDWTLVPIGTMTNMGEFRGYYSGFSNERRFVTELRSSKIGNQHHHEINDLRLAPASEQPWINWRGGECPVPEGVIVEVTLRDGDQLTRLSSDYHWAYGCSQMRSRNIIEYRVTGLTDGYTDDPAKGEQA